MEVYFYLYKKPLHCFLRVTTLCCVSTCNMWAFQLLCILPPVFSTFFIIAILIGVYWNLIMVLSCIPNNSGCRTSFRMCICHVCIIGCVCSRNFAVVRIINHWFVESSIFQQVHCWHWGGIISGSICYPFHCSLFRFSRTQNAWSMWSCDD